MANFEIIRDDVIMLTIAGVRMLVLVEVIRSARRVDLMAGEDLSSFTRLLPDRSPNALERILLCGPAAQAGHGSLDPQTVESVVFSGPEICVNYNDVEAHWPKPREPMPEGGVQRK